MKRAGTIPSADSESTRNVTGGVLWASCWPIGTDTEQQQACPHTLHPHTSSRRTIRLAWTPKRAGARNHRPTDTRRQQGVQQPRSARAGVKRLATSVRDCTPSTRLPAPLRGTLPCACRAAFRQHATMGIPRTRVRRNRRWHLPRQARDTRGGSRCRHQQPTDVRHTATSTAHSEPTHSHARTATQHHREYGERHHWRARATAAKGRTRRATDAVGSRQAMHHARLSEHAAVWGTRKAGTQPHRQAQQHDSAGVWCGLVKHPQAGAQARSVRLPLR